MTIAPPRPARLHGDLVLPADKSIAQRALICTALGSPRGPEAPRLVIDRPGADIRSIAAVMAALGSLAIEEDGERLAVRVLGRPNRLGNTQTPLVLDCGNSGTGMRLLAGAAANLLATRGGQIVLTGDASLSARPMERVAGPLRQMGAAISTTGGYAPITLSGPAPLRAMEHRLPVASAQLLSAVALAALAAEGTTTIHLPGPARDHTERMLTYLRAPAVRTGSATTLDGPVELQLTDVAVPGDVSAAAFWLVAATVHPDARLTLRNVGLNPTRTALIDALTEMGARIEVTETRTGPEPSGDITVDSAPRLRAIDISGTRTADLIDELPVLAVAMAGAEGTSTVRDAGELRVKESDRIALTCAMLEVAGLDATAHHDGWDIAGSAQRYPSAGEAATIETGADHRIAMACAILDVTGVAPRPVVPDDRDCAAVSYPRFFADLAALTGDGK